MAWGQLCGSMAAGPVQVWHRWEQECKSYSSSMTEEKQMELPGRKMWVLQGQFKHDIGENRYALGTFTAVDFFLFLYRWEQAIDLRFCKCEVATWWSFAVAVLFFCCCFLRQKKKKDWRVSFVVLVLPVFLTICLPQSCFLFKLWHWFATISMKQEDDKDLLFWLEQVKIQLNMLLEG